MGIIPVTLVRAVNSAHALKSGSPAQLVVAVEEAERHGLVVHAARMRIVLARLTGDDASLQLVRPVLERPGDRQFLRRLEEVESSICLGAVGSSTGASPK